MVETPPPKKKKTAQFTIPITHTRTHAHTHTHTYVACLVVKLDCPLERSARGDGGELVHSREHRAVVPHVEPGEVSAHLFDVVGCDPANVFEKEMTCEARGVGMVLLV